MTESAADDSALSSAPAAEVPHPGASSTAKPAKKKVHKRAKKQIHKTNKAATPAEPAGK